MNQIFSSATVEPAAVKFRSRSPRATRLFIATLGCLTMEQQHGSFHGNGPIAGTGHDGEVITENLGEGPKAFASVVQEEKKGGRITGPFFSLPR